jgi:hypothetical protein
MSKPNETAFHVFYSWQFDLPGAVNLKLIRGALSEAANALSGDHDANIHVVIDEATREVPGSPNIADSIFAKIRASDAFVCDLTKVAETANAAGELRKYCNPNVAIELGYAVRVLGWNRIIIVFNEGYGVIPDDLPFDARMHRTSRYRCEADLHANGKPTPTCQSLIKNASGHLRAILLDGFKLIINQNPKRPEELELRTPEEIRRARDVQQLREIFRWINLNLMDRIITSVAEGKMLYVSEFMYDCLAGEMQSSSFHIADAEMSKRLGTFAAAWRETFKYAHEMDPHPNGEGGYFRMPMDIPTSIEQGEQFDYTTKQWQPLRASLDELVKYIRLQYLEIDPALTGSEELKEYRSRQKAAREQMKTAFRNDDK